MIRRTTIAAIAALAAVSVPAIARELRMYNLETGAVSVLKFSNKWLSGHGPVRGMLASGEYVQGEFTTVPRSSSTWGSIYANGVTASGSRTSMSNDQRGSAVVSGAGLVIQCEYVVSALSGHGSGACEDNKGTKYRVMF